MKHFNTANVWGILREASRKETKDKVPYLAVAISCHNAQYGNVKVFGKIWGKPNVELFEAAHPVGSRVNLRGVLAQYVSRGKVKSNFNFYKFALWNPTESGHKENRATFVLVGRVAAYEDEGDEGLLTLELDRGSSIETLKVAVPMEVNLAFPGELTPGLVVSVKGRIMQTEDEWGEVIKPSRPVAIAITDRTEKAEPVQEDVPF